MTLSKLSTEVSTKKSYSLHAHRAVKSPRPLAVTLLALLPVREVWGEKVKDTQWEFEVRLTGCEDSGRGMSHFLNHLCSLPQAFPNRLPPNANSAQAFLAV